jgi:hypothetical protein
MPVYEYKCGNGHVESHYFHVDDRWRPVGLACFECAGQMHRVFSFRPARVMHEHFNESVGQPVSSMRQFEDILKRRNDEMTERTGIPHNAEAMSFSDLAPPEV